MKRAIVVLVVALVIAIAGVNAVSSDAQNNPLPKTCTAQAFRPFSAAVWSHKAWERGNPPQSVIRAFRKRLRCAPPAHRKAMKAMWYRDRHSFHEYATKLHRNFINYTWPGATYPESAWFGLPEMKPYVAAALAEAAGEYTGTQMPGWTMVQISQGEGDLKPGSRSTDDGYGWLAVTAPYGDSFGVVGMGGYEEMLNPVKNAFVAAEMYGYQGLAAWHGDSHVTDSDAHYHGKFDIRDALGGLTFGQALRRANR